MDRCETGPIGQGERRSIFLAELDALCGPNITRRFQNRRESEEEKVGDITCL